MEYILLINDKHLNGTRIIQDLTKETYLPFFVIN